MSDREVDIFLMPEHIYHHESCRWKLKIVLFKKIITRKTLIDSLYFFTGAIFLCLTSFDLQEKRESRKPSKVILRYIPLNQGNRQALTFYLSVRQGANRTPIP